MLHIRRSGERSSSDDNWIRTRHSFSHDDDRGISGAHGFRCIRAIDESVGGPGGASPMTRRQDREIITYVVEGALAHNDEMNNGTILFPGDIHRTTAGRGITHREFNHSETEPVHFIRFEIEPAMQGLVPGYEQRMFVHEESLGAFLLLASSDGREHSVTVHQDLELYLSTLEPGMKARYRLGPGRAAWVQLVRGRISLNGEELHAGDGAPLTDEGELTLVGIEAAEVLLVDVG